MVSHKINQAVTIFNLTMDNEQGFNFINLIEIQANSVQEIFYLYLSIQQE